MISRYDIMNGSETQYDPVDNQVWPDSLSADFESFQFTQPPYIVEPDERLQKYPYIVTNAFYQSTEYDDIIFNINIVPHVSLLFNVDAAGNLLFPTLKFPVISDLTAFMKKD